MAQSFPIKHTLCARQAGAAPPGRLPAGIQLLTLFLYALLQPARADETPAVLPEVENAIPAPAIAAPAVIQAPAEQSSNATAEEKERRSEKERRAEQAEASSNEDPDALRRQKRRAERQAAREASAKETGTGDSPAATSPDQHPATGAEQTVTEQPTPQLDPEPPKRSWNIEAYGSLRLHGIDHFDPKTGETTLELGDGASRVGASVAWSINDTWDFFGRAELGFDILDTFTPKANGDSNGKLEDRLTYLGIESDAVYLRIGKSYSVYYTVAGDADRFSIFGGNASGIYNAGTDGGATGTGRADDAIQTRVYLDPQGLIAIKPFNINLQYQAGQPIPHVTGEDYRHSWSASGWLENDWEVGVGLALHNASIENPNSAAVLAAGIDGDALATALALRSYGERWLVSLVLSRLKNIETTDELRYINGNGAELFAQWQFADKLWLTGGGNWLLPDDDDPDAADFNTKYGVLGLRYTFDSFNRMVYAEWRNDHGSLASGLPRKDEFTIGLRWDLNY